MGTLPPLEGMNYYLQFQPLQLQLMPRACGDFNFSSARLDPVRYLIFRYLIDNHECAYGKVTHSGSSLIFL